MSRGPDTSFYEMLEVSQNASFEEIEASYQRITEVLGPSSLAVYSLMDEEEAQAMRSRLEEAYRTLSDPDRRAAYDRARSSSSSYPSVLVPDVRTDASVSMGVVGGQKPKPQDDLVDVEEIFREAGAAPDPVLDHNMMPLVEARQEIDRRRQQNDEQRLDEEARRRELDEERQGEARRREQDEETARRRELEVEADRRRALDAEADRRRALDDEADRRRAIDDNASRSVSEAKYNERSHLTLDAERHEAERRRTEAEAERRSTDAEAERRRTDAEAERRRTDAEAERRRTDAETDRRRTDAEADRRRAEAEAPRRDAPPAEPVQPRRPQPLSKVPSRPGFGRPAPSPQVPGPGKRRSLKPSADIAVDFDAEFSGAIFRRLRESCNATLDEVAEITKISKRYIAALEENDFEALPATVYVRGFVSEYARVLCLDPTRVAQSYMALYKRYKGEGGLG